MTVLVGAYASAPRPIQSDAQFRAFTDAVTAMPLVGGFEIPFRAGEHRWNRTDWLADGDPSHRHVVTMVPAFVGGLAAQPGLGLASADAEGRRAALALVAEAREWIATADAAAAGRITGLELHSSPPAARSDVSAFADSLAEIVEMGWEGIEVSIEHCDALVPEHPPAKGYLPLASEMELASRHGIGVTINWGRSAIETRSAAGATEQLRAVAAAGLLSGVVFSSAAPDETDLGPAWGDVHLPVRDWAAGTALAGSDFERAATSSLLTSAGVADALRGLSPSFVGVKVAPSPSASDSERVDLVRAHVQLVADAMT